MKMKRKEGFFSISAVAKMFSIHQQTIRLYEKEGLITPKRSSGNTRLFGEEDIDRLEEIIYLTHELGINLAGVEMIFKLKRQIGKLQKEMNKVFDTTQKELDLQAEASKSMVNTSAQRLMKMRPDAVKKIALIEQARSKTEEGNEPIDTDRWEIEYED